MEKFHTSNEFPIIFKLCVSESTHRKDNSKYEKFGYKDEKSFYLGEIAAEDRYVGWADWNQNVYLSGMRQDVRYLFIYYINQLRNSGAHPSQLVFNC